MTSAPPFVRFLFQRYPHGDCGVRTAAMFANVTYEEALIAAAKVKPTVLKAGLTWPQMRATLRRLGLKTRLRVVPPDLSEVTGILYVVRVALGVADKGEHLVFLWDGRVLEGNGECWGDVELYLRHYGYEAKGLLIAKED